MIERGQISSAQLGIMMIPTVLATSILSVPSQTMAHSGHDMWLSPLYAGIMGLLAVWIAISLGRLYPKCTLIEAGTSILGKWGGWLIGLSYVFYLPHLTGVVISQYGQFINGNALPRTPSFIVTGTLVFVCALNVRSGIEVIGRSSQIFTTLFVVLLAVLFVLLTGELDLAELLPFGERGLAASLKGAFGPSAWFSEYIAIAFMLPYVRDRNKAWSKCNMSVLFVTLAMTMTNLVCLFLMGDLTDSFIYPVMIAARYITIADFMQHLEALVIAIWISGIYVKISVFLYIFSVVVAQWLNLKDYRPIVMPLAFLCTVYAYWVAGSQADLAAIYGPSGNIYTLIFLFVLPLLLLVWGYLKHKLQKRGVAL